MSDRNQYLKKKQGGECFCECDSSFFPLDIDQPSPLGARLLSIETGYTVYAAPDGTGVSTFDNFELTSKQIPAKHILLKDQSADLTWSPFVCKEGIYHRDFSVKYNPGIVRINSTEHKIASSLTLFVSPKGSFEVWLIHLQNLSAAERILTLDAGVICSEEIGGRTYTSKSGKTICLKIAHPEISSPENSKSLYFASTLQPICHHTSAEDFCSPF